MLKLVPMAVVLVLSYSCQARLSSSELEGASKKQHCLDACPEVKKGNRLVVHDIYSLSNNPDTKFADWAAYKVTPESLGAGSEGVRAWQADPTLPETETLEPPDYAGAFEELEVDRGHQVPLASFLGTQFWKETNYLSNITPQKSALNQGPWKRLETAERNLTKKFDAVWVLTGPVYEASEPTLPHADEEHRVPSAYWKVITLMDGDRRITGGFYFEQDTDREADICQHVMSLKNIQKYSKLNASLGSGGKRLDENNEFLSLINCL